MPQTWLLWNFLYIFCKPNFKHHSVGYIDNKAVKANANFFILLIICLSLEFQTSR